jgi:RNA polymerase sigma-70 factor (ECF subfamily)
MTAWCVRTAARLGCRDDADDIAQEAVLRAWRHRRSCRTPEQPWAWLSTITRREAARRHVGVVIDLDEAQEPALPDPAIEDAAERLTIWPAVASLDRAGRAVVVLHYVHDVSVADIARMLDMPIGSVKVKLHRVRDKLRADLPR